VTITEPQHAKDDLRLFGNPIWFWS